MDKLRNKSNELISKCRIETPYVFADGCRVEFGERYCWLQLLYDFRAAVDQLLIANFSKGFERTAMFLLCRALRG